MKGKEIIIHRIRDFDAALHSKRIMSTLTYVFLRQFCKFFRIDEKKIQSLIKNNVVYLDGYKFRARARTLDFLFISRYYEPETTRFILNLRGNTFIDIGAHIGRYGVLASKNFKKIYAFEPQPSNYQILKQNISTNKIKNVKPINLAVSSKEKTVYMSDLVMNTGAAHLSKKGKIKAKTCTLDKYLGKRVHPGSKEIDLILIDVENHELEVIKGSRRLLKQGNPILIIECLDINKIEWYLFILGYKRIKTLDFYNHVFVKSKPACSAHI